MRQPAAAEALKALPEAAAGVVRALLARADAEGLRVHLVGGPVRDLLLQRPVHDVDLLVEREGGVGALELAQRSEGVGLRVTSHGRFGTVTLRGPEAAVDLATARRESYAHDGALPSVEEGSLEEDLRRRDFSVNALALPLSRAAVEAHPAVVDVAGGLADLEARRLRVLHGRSFHDDPTRALRAARLAPRLGFSLTRSTRAALRDALRDGATGRVSGERLRREIVKLFEDPRQGLDPSRALRLLDEWHVLAAIEPGLSFPSRAVAPVRRLGKAVAQPPWRAARWRPWVSGLALWLAALGPGLRRRTLQRFAIRGQVAETLLRFPRSRDTTLRQLARARGRGPTDAALYEHPDDLLHAVFASAPPPVRRRIQRWAVEDRTRRPPVGGEDLVALGLGGPVVGRALRRIRIAYLDGAVRSRDEALALAREVARPPRGRGAGR